MIILIIAKRVCWIIHTRNILPDILFIEWIEDINSTADFALDCEYIGSTFGETEFMQEVEKKVSKRV